MENTPSSSDGSVTPTPDTPVTGTPVSQSVTPEKPTTTAASEETAARIAELERALKNATEERDRHRKKLSGYEDAERKAQEAQLSEIEKASKRAAEFEARSEQYRQQLVTTQIKLAAQSQGVIDPDLASLAIQASLKYGDDGMPTNIDEALKALIEQKPFLLAPRPAEPAQPAEQPPARVGAPAVPAMNPGRSTIAAPGSTQSGRIPRLSDPGVLVPPGTVSRYQP